MSDAFLLIGPYLVFVLGLLLGSFANVIIYRWPKEQSVIAPRSACVNCNTPIYWYDNIPIVSFLFLKGECRQCKKKISLRYPLIELLTACLFLAAYLYVGPQWVLLEYLIFIFGLVVISVIDLDHFLIPDVISLPGIAIGLVGAFVNPEREFMSALTGVLVGGGFLWSVAWVYQIIRKEEGLGGGDIKLIAWIGAVLGGISVPFVILVSSVIGSIVGIMQAVRTKGGMKTMIPFGPFLALAALIYLFGGKSLAVWYLQMFLPWITG